ncbi:MAG: type II toxin-antitoxin system VapC family toxin [Xanthomonadales bacterium]|nr:type II toxin-antitoxin system VapC family toxin [Xanthomonadales bacterium]
MHPLRRGPERGQPVEDRHQAQLGGGQMPVSATQALAYFQQAGFELLEVKPEHAVGVERLPLLHPDAFDRLLIAQARWEPMRLLTRDAKMLAYGDGIEAA